MKSGNRFLLSAIGFLLLTLILTYPLVLDLGRAVKDHGDPLLNAWILAWEVHWLSDPSASDLFDTNIFYPHHNTLAYSELLLTQQLLAAPVILLTGNAILAHNLVMVASFLLTALTTYLLAFHLTRSQSASFTAGLILAFCPFMFSHLPHVQIILAAGLPLCFLALHRYFEERRARYLALFGACYCLQALANTYYAVYLSFFAGLYLVFGVARHRIWRERKFWRQIGVLGVLVVIVLAPFYGRYLKLKSETGFERSIGTTTALTSYLATPEFNRLYGGSSRSLGRTEQELFPGLTALILAGLGLSERLHRRPRPSNGPLGKSSSTPLRLSFRTAELMILLAVATIVVVIVTGGVRVEVAGLELRATSFRNPALALLVLAALRSLLLRRFPHACRSWFPRLSRPTYPVLLLLSFLLAFGSGPYRLLHQYLPGFSSLRAVPRIHVVFMFALAILAAEGMTALLAKLPRRWRRISALAIPLLVCLEYLSAPIPLMAAPALEAPPAVHRWLGEQSAETVYATLPFRHRLEHRRMYYSTTHWRRTVNGFSGYIPPLYTELGDRSRKFPSREVIADLQSLGIDLIVVEVAELNRVQKRRLTSTSRFKRLVLVAELDGHQVYALRQPGPDRRTGKMDQQQLDAQLSEQQLRPLDSSLWTVRTSFDPHRASRLIDGDSQRRWHAPMRPGEWVEVDLGEIAEVCAVELDLGGAINHYPRGYRVEVSLDGSRWSEVAHQNRVRPAITDLLEPLEMKIVAKFSTSSARYLRFWQTRSHPTYSWGIGELRILTTAGPETESG